MPIICYFYMVAFDKFTLIYLQISKHWLHYVWVIIFYDFINKLTVILIPPARLESQNPSATARPVGSHPFPVQTPLLPP